MFINDILGKQIFLFQVLGESLVLINCHFESKEVLNLSSSDFVNQFEAFCESDKIVAAVSTTCRQSKFAPLFFFFSDYNPL